jgi:N-methylhydantoinase B
MVIATAGGGGYGAATERDAADVQKDLRDGKISLEAAREFYGYRGNV